LALVRKKILIVTESLDLGGVETQILSQLSETSESYEYCIVSSGGSLVSKATSFSAKHFAVNFSVLQKEEILKVADKIANIIRTNKINLVHIHPFGTIYPTILACFQTNTPYVITMHGVPTFDWGNAYGPEYKYFWSKILFKNAQKVVAITEEVRDFLEKELQVSNSKIVVLPNYLPDGFRENRSVAEINRFVCLGRVDADRLDLLKGALSVISSKAVVNKNMSLDIIGSGGALNEVVECARVINERLGREVVSFRGQINDVEEVLNSYDAVIGMGRSALESIQSKRLTIVIGYDGFLRGVLDGANFKDFSFANFTGRNLPTCSEETFWETISSQSYVKRAIQGAYDEYLKYFDKSKISLELRQMYGEATNEPKEMKIEESLELINTFLEIKNLTYLERESALAAITQLNFEISNLNTELTSQKEEIRVIKNSRTWRYGILMGTILKQPKQIPAVVARALKSLLRRVLPQPVKNKLKALKFEHPYLFSPKLAFRQHQYKAQLAAILKAGDYKGIVIYPPTIDWHMPLFQRPQQLAQAFAREGYLFFYGSANLTHDKIDGFEKIEKGLYVTNVTPVLKDLKDSYLLISWPLNKPFAAQFSNSKIIYDYIDELEVFDSRGKTESEMYRNHEFLVKNADLVIATADKLLNSVNKLNPKRAILAPNGVELEHFNKQIKTPPKDISELVSSGKKVIGYYGAIAEWFDYQLLEDIALLRPDYEFVMIGPLDYDRTLHEHKHLFEVPNIHFVGPKKYDELPSYLYYFDVATIPFLVNKITESTSPVKLFEYMAGGRPIVTTGMYECKKYKSVLIGEDAHDFADKLDLAISLQKNKDYLKQLREDAENNTWKKRAEEIIENL